jgi:hypothetical protein
VIASDWIITPAVRAEDRERSTRGLITRPPRGSTNAGAARVFGLPLPRRPGMLWTIVVIVVIVLAVIGLFRVMRGRA